MVALAVDIRAAHANDKVTVPVIRSRGGNAVAGFIQGAGLYAGGIGVILIVIAQKHTVRRGNGAFLACHVRRRLRVIRLRGDIRKIRHCQRILRNDRHLARGGVVVFIIQAVRVHKMRVCAAELHGLLVHQLHTAHFAVTVFVILRVVGRDIQRIHIFCKRQRGIIAGWHHHQVQKLIDGKAFARLNFRQRRARALKLLGNAFRHRSARVLQVADRFRRDDIRHDLRHGSHGAALVRIICIDNGIGVEAHHIDRSAVRVCELIARKAHFAAFGHDRVCRCVGFRSRGIGSCGIFARGAFGCIGQNAGRQNGKRQQNACAYR